MERRVKILEDEHGFVISYGLSDDIIPVGVVNYCGYASNAKGIDIQFVSPDDSTYLKTIDVPAEMYEQIFLNHETNLIDGYDSFQKQLSETHGKETKQYSLTDLNADFYLSESCFKDEDSIDLGRNYNLVPFVLKK